MILGDLFHIESVQNYKTHFYDSCYENYYDKGIINEEHIFTEHEIVLDKIYRKDLEYYIFISELNKLISEKEASVLNIKDIHKPLIEELDALRHLIMKNIFKIQQDTNKHSHNYNPDVVIINSNYKFLEYQIIEILNNISRTFGQLRLYFVDNIGDNIIICGKPDRYDNNKLILFKSEYRCNITCFGNYSNYYKVINIHCDKYIRMEKLKRILYDY